MPDLARLPPSSASSTRSPTVHEEPDVSHSANVFSQATDTERKSLKNLNEKASESEFAEDGALIVNWEGPDDPENPKKYVIDLSSFAATESDVCGRNRPVRSIAAGLFRANGLRPSSSPPSRSSAPFLLP